MFLFVVISGWVVKVTIKSEMTSVVLAKLLHLLVGLNIVHLLKWRNSSLLRHILAVSLILLESHFLLVAVCLGADSIFQLEWGLPILRHIHGSGLGLVFGFTDLVHSFSNELVEIDSVILWLDVLISVSQSLLSNICLIILFEWDSSKI